jgi:transcriptional regulator with XRE-family HTH domain
MNVNQRIKKYLEEHGITQVFLEKKTGISHDKLSRLLNCKRKVTAEELSKISQALNVPINIFLD